MIDAWNHQFQAVYDLPGNDRERQRSVQDFEETWDSVAALPEYTVRMQE